MIKKKQETISGFLDLSSMDPDDAEEHTPMDKYEDNFVIFPPDQLVFQFQVLNQYLDLRKSGIPPAMASVVPGIPPLAPSSLPGSANLVRVGSAKMPKLMPKSVSGRGSSLQHPYHEYGAPRGSLNEEQEPVMIKPRMYACNSCPFVSTVAFDFVHHCIAVHLRVFPYGCTTCSIQNSTFRNADQHARRMHENLEEGISYQCAKCQRNFLLPSNLIYHYFRRHYDPSADLLALYSQELTAPSRVGSSSILKAKN